MSDSERLPLKGQVKAAAKLKSPFFQPSTKAPSAPLSTESGEDADQENTSTITEASANLINAIVGAGIVGIPYAIKEAGLVTGLFLVIFCALLTEKSLRMLVETAKLVKVPSYETVAEVSFGRLGFLFVSLNMFVMAYGAMVSYLIVIKDTLPTVMGVGNNPEDLPFRRGILFVSSLLIILPLSMKRDMADLAKTSSISCIFDLCLVILVSYLSPEKNLARFDEAMDVVMDEETNIPSGEPVNTQLLSLLKSDVLHPSTVFVGLGVLSFAFVCQHSAFIIAGSLRTPTRARWAQVTRLSLSICVFLATVMGLSGYLGFGANTEGNILNNLGDNHGANLARLLLSSTMFFVYPMESFVARHVLVVSLFQGKVAHDGDDHAILARGDRRRNLTISLYTAAIVPALIFPNVGTVLAITGCIGGSCLSYIGPGLVYVGIHGRQFMKIVDESLLNLHDAVDADSSSENDESDFIISPFKFCDKIYMSLKRFCGYTLFYISGTPVWYAIAKFGSSRREAHEYRVAAATPNTRNRSLRGRISSPMPQRPMIGSMAKGNSFRSMTVKDESLPGKLISPLASPLASPLQPTPNSSKLTNQNLGKLYLNQLQSKDSAEDASLPDFIVAIFYVVWGTIALIAGILSILSE